MIIAFDLDDTLIPTTLSFACGVERPRAPIGWVAREPIRKGAIELFDGLRQAHGIWIYTTSLRSRLGIRFWLLQYGLRVDRIINLDAHVETVRGSTYQQFSKAPRAFGIDLLIDDSAGVAIECERQHAHCLIVDPNDADWVLTVHGAVRAI
jgi:hypothetical protein